VAGLGAGLALLQDEGFKLSGRFRFAFAGWMLLLMISALTSCGAIITRALDFRLTARAVRKKRHPNYDKSLTILGLGSDGYGRATWALLWCGSFSLLIGAVLLAVSMAGGYWDRWIPTVGMMNSAAGPSASAPDPVDTGIDVPRFITMYPR
jgi:hypothetical protein